MGEKCRSCLLLFLSLVCPFFPSLRSPVSNHAGVEPSSAIYHHWQHCPAPLPIGAPEVSPGRAREVDDEPDKGDPPVSPSAPPSFPLSRSPTGGLCPSMQSRAPPCPRTGLVADQRSPFRWGPTYHPLFA